LKDSCYFWDVVHAQHLYLIQGGEPLVDKYISTQLSVGEEDNVCRGYKICKNQCQLNSKKRMTMCSTQLLMKEEEPGLKVEEVDKETFLRLINLTAMGYRPFGFLIKRIFMIRFLKLSYTTERTGIYIDQPAATSRENVFPLTCVTEISSRYQDSASSK